MRVVIPGNPALHFQRPLRVLRAYDRAEVADALHSAQEACDAGLYCAGYLCYEAGAALLGQPGAASRLAPLLALGIYTEPHIGPLRPAQRDFRMGTLRPRVSRERYGRAVRTIAQAIYEGEVYQVNYTVPFDFAFSGDPYGLFCELLQRSEVAHAAYVEDEALSIVSLSPELFLNVQGTTITTKPMKGTAPADQQQRLLDPKNRAEHLMIVDLLRNDLHRICSDVQVPELYTIEPYPTLLTMTSTVRGTLRSSTTLLDMFRATFPCGSITGAPKLAAMQAIARIEEAPRELYTGTIGYRGPDGHGMWNVAIRTLQIDTANGRGRFDAGGGIVADSSPDDEWAEIQLKSRFLEGTMEPIALLETFAADALPERISAHFERLAASAAHFGIPLDIDSIRAEATSLMRNASSLVRLRVEWDGAFSLRTQEITPSTQPVSIRLLQRLVHSKDPFLRHKTSWRQTFDQAHAVASRAGCFDAIATNERDELTEGTRTSLFVEVDGRLHTPPLASGVLPGILRSELLQQGRCIEKVLYERDLHRASALYIGNSARGLLRAHLAKELTGVP